MNLKQFPSVMLRCANIADCTTSYDHCYPCIEIVNVDSVTAKLMVIFLMARVCQWNETATQTMIEVVCVILPADNNLHWASRLIAKTA